jgi:hypothetical protein
MSENAHYTPHMLEAIKTAHPQLTEQTGLPVRYERASELLTFAN